MTSPEDWGLGDPDDATCALHYAWELPGYVVHPASQLCCPVASLTDLPPAPAKATSTSSHLIPSDEDSFPTPPSPLPPTLCFYCYYCYYRSLHQHSPLRLLLGEALSCLPLCCLKTTGPPPAPFEHKGPCHLWNDECKYLQWDSNFTLLAFLKISCIPPLLSSHGDPIR